MIPVTKPYLPPLEQYQTYLNGIYQRNHLTNSGPLYQELTERLKRYLGVDYLLLVSNGTLALQVAMKALQLDNSKPIVTTAFSFAATTGAIAWEGFKTQFCDIDLNDFNIDVKQLADIQSASAILPVHVFGCPSQTDHIAQQAMRLNCKVIYDAAHAFGIEADGQSILNAGDASTLSFHATKLFHCVEGGAIVFKQESDYLRAKQMINFGLDEYGEAIEIGINAKLSEMHAAMGLTVLDNIGQVRAEREAQLNQYKQLLSPVLQMQHWPQNVKNNGAYVPVLFENEDALLKVADALKQQDIVPRRYFYPTLSSSAAFRSEQQYSVAENIASRILCLPAYSGLSKHQITHICDIILTTLDVK